MSTIIQKLDTILSENPDAIETWFAQEFEKTPPSFYSSVDLRHSGHKIAPVDTNLFPAGFNNLNAEAAARAAEQAKQYLHAYYPNAKNILILPESHTRNLFYLDNIASLQRILEQAGAKVVIGFLDTSEPSFTFTSASGAPVHFESLKREGNTLATVQGFVPDIILLNNDLTTGIPDILQNLTQPAIPSPERGWHQRKKSNHFTAYNTLTRQFAEKFGFDPWLISTIFHQCGTIDFKEKKGVECVALAVDKVLHQLRQKYEEYGITDTPYVFIKAERGTYGMGIMTATSGEELFSMNKKIRKKMETVKGGTINNEVIIQEGIPTIDMVRGHVAEPFIYLIGSEPVGCIYRINQTRDAYDNLNAAGMTFEQNICEEVTPQKNNEKPCKRMVFSLVSRLAALAAVRESAHQTAEETKKAIL